MAAEMTLTISAVDKATAVFQAVENKARDFGGKIRGAMQSVFDNFTQLHFVVNDAIQLIGKAFESMEKFASFVEVRDQLNILAAQFGTTADAIVASMKRVTDGQFSIEEATRAAAGALKNSLTPEQILGLAEAAATFNDIAGVSVPEAFERLANAVQKGNARAAASILGKEGLGDAMAALGKGATDAEKSTALYEAIMAKTAETSALFAGQQKSLGNQIDATKAKVADAKLRLDEYATKGLLVAIAAGELFMVGIAKISGLIGDLLSKITSIVPGMGEFSRKMQESADNLWKFAAAHEKSAGDFVALAKSIGDQTTAVKAQAVAVTDAATAVDAATAKWKLINGVWTDTTAGAEKAAAGLGQIKTAADALPKDIAVKVTTTYVDVRDPQANAATAAGQGGGPDGTSYGNWGGAY